jgi:hypothetical protein
MPLKHALNGAGVDLQFDRIAEVLFVGSYPCAVLADELRILDDLLELGDVGLDVDEVTHVCLVSTVGHLDRHVSFPPGH